MKHILLYAVLITVTLSNTLQAQNINYSTQEVAINKLIDGTLLRPNDTKKPVLAIIIAGSGPTDRNGNQNFVKNNALKKLAESLSNANIATFRYDKRIVKQIQQRYVDPNIMFDDFVTDAKSVISYFKAQNEFSKIYVLGHSQGSLVGMLAAKENVDGFVSLAGAGQSIDQVIMEQITKMDPKLVEGTKAALAELKSGKTTTTYPIALGAIFNPSTQPFMINWMSYNPQDIIKTLNIPILIVNGTKDLQVNVTDATLLHEASKTAQLKIIEHMNHIFVTIEGDDLDNSKSYNESARKISKELITSLINFIK